MNYLILDSDNRNTLAQWLASDTCVVACLCAAWCDTCASYQGKFAELASRHPEQRFVWIDIEDQADLVGDLDVENFPTLLVQQDDLIGFYGPVLPELRLAERLVGSQVEKSPADRQTEAHATEQRKTWQQECNLQLRLNHLPNK